MKKISLVLITVFITILLWGSNVFFYQKKDIIAPQITINETELIYKEGMEEEQLFLGVSAWDGQDGNLDDKIIIEKIVTDDAKKTAIITYGVSDGSGNVGKLNRKVGYLVPRE